MRSLEQETVSRLTEEANARVDEYASAFRKRYPDVDPSDVELQVDRSDVLNPVYRIVRFDNSLLGRQLKAARELAKELEENLILESAALARARRERAEFLERIDLVENALEEMSCRYCVDEDCGRCHLSYAKRLVENPLRPVDDVRADPRAYTYEAFMKDKQGRW